MHPLPEGRCILHPCAGVSSRLGLPQLGDPGDFDISLTQRRLLNDCIRPVLIHRPLILILRFIRLTCAMCSALPRLPPLLLSRASPPDMGFGPWPPPPWRCPGQFPEPRPVAAARAPVSIYDDDDDDGDDDDVEE